MIAPAASGPHLIAWNLTTRCNLSCPHCYVDAHRTGSHVGELDTAACLGVVDQIMEATSSPMIVLTGGEPLLRIDVENIAEHATKRGATVVVGTNGTGLTPGRVASLKAAGVTGYALSVDSLNPSIHDSFRGLPGALDRTFAAVDALRAAEQGFVVQTTLSSDNFGELDALAAWAEAVGALVFNVFIEVSTGRASSRVPLPAADVEAAGRRIVELERRYRGRLRVRSKCQPHLVRHVARSEPDSPLLARGAGCPAGLWYCRIDARGRVTPCPYLPLVAGDLATTSFAAVWRDAPVFRALREQPLGGTCGACDLRQVCRGCRARPFAAQGDLLGADDTCTHKPAAGADVLPARPFALGAAPAPQLQWTPEATALLARIPGFVRGMVVGRIESWARTKGIATVDAAMLTELKGHMTGRRAVPDAAR